MMTCNEIRAKFLEFFESKGHTIVPSAPMVVKNDPTLMFTNAGMNQFKEIFLGNAERKFPRAADTQKCLMNTKMIYLRVMSKAETIMGKKNWKR